MSLGKSPFVESEVPLQGRHPVPLQKPIEDFAVASAVPLAELLDQLQQHHGLELPLVFPGQRSFSECPRSRSRSRGGSGRNLYLLAGRTNASGVEEEG